jgi:hypothetical protein
MNSTTQILLFQLRRFHWKNVQNIQAKSISTHPLLQLTILLVISQAWEGCFVNAFRQYIYGGVVLQDVIVSSLRMMKVSPVFVGFMLDRSLHSSSLHRKRSNIPQRLSPGLRQSATLPVLLQGCGKFIEN